jgi:type I restriction enzyme S subunit
MKTRLRHVTQVNPPSRRFDRLAEDDLVPFLPLENVWSGDKLDLSHVRPKSDVAVGYTRFESGDVVVPKITPTFEASRSVLIPDLPNSVGTGTTELHVVRPGSDIEPRYLLYVFHSYDFLKLGEAEMYGVAGQKRVSDGLIRNWTVDLPPLDEQRRIADFLDAETARIDCLDELASSTASVLAERRHVLLEQAIVDGSAPPQKLFRGLRLLRDGTHQPPPRTSTGVPLLTARNVSSGLLQLTEQDTFVSPEDAEVLETSLRPQYRDLLLSVKGTIGAVAIVPPGFPRAVLDRNLALLRPHPTLLNEWLLWVLRTQNLQEQMNLSVTAAAQPGLPLGAIRELRIPSADIEVQNEQVRVIEMLNQEMVDLESKIQSQRDLLAERRQALITAAVTRQIDVTTAGGLVPAGGAAI